jgi:porin
MRHHILAFLSVFILFTTEAMATDSYLLGNWGEMRNYLEDRGVTSEVVITTDLIRNVSGGVETHGTLLGNIDMTFEMDTNKAGLWKNGTFFVYILGNTVNNRYLSDLVGDTQVTSNIEAEEALRIYEAWYEHRFNDDSVSFLFGLHDYNGEFDVLEYSALFTNSSFGIQPTISQSGPSIFPNTALAGRLKYNPAEDLYLMAALYDGVSGDPDHSSRTDIRFDTGDGIFTGFEGGISHGAPMARDYYKIAIGTWLHTAETEHFDGTKGDDNSGIYLIGEQTLYAENDNGEGLGAFIEFGWADDVNEVTLYWSAGINYVGLIPNRNADIFGLAIAVARNGEDFMDYTKSQGDAINHTETAIELTYRAEIIDWLVLQPDVQYVLNPNMNPELDDALIIGVRMEISL